MIVMNGKDLQREFSAFQSYNESRGLSGKTIGNYMNALQLFYRWFANQYGEEAEVTGRRIRGWLAYKLRKGNKPKSVATYYGSLRAFFSFLVLDEVIAEDDNPMRLVKRPRVPMTEIEPLAMEQIRNLLDTFDTAKPAGHRDYLICLLILDTGLRSGEVTSLAVNDVNFGKSSIVVNNGKGGKRRIVYMGRKMRGMLVDYAETVRPLIANGRQAFFPPAGNSRHEQLRVCYLSHVIHDKMHEAGIKTNGSSTHRLRHTFAVNFIRGGGGAFALQRLLGHTTLEMTRRYVALATDDVQEAHAKASPVDRMELS